MHDTAERVKRVKLRISERRHKQDNQLIVGLFTLCSVLSISLIAVIVTIEGKGVGVVPGMYGMMLLYEGAGGYVLVSVITFAAAVIITLLCIRGKEKSNKNKNDNDDHLRKE